MTGKVPTRVALLGLGEAARNIHLPACRRIAGSSLVAGADPDEKRRETFAALAKGITLYADAESLLEAERPDWVVVGAPPSAHRALCLLSLERGAQVFCEKPFVERLEEADELIRISEAAGRAIAVNHEFPHMPIFAAARDAIGSDAFGDLVFVQAWQHLHERPEELPGWRSAGRTLQEFGPHVVDLLVGFFGALPESVFAVMPGSGADGADLIDVVTLGFPGDRAASIVLDRASRGEHRYLEMRLDGQRASLRASIGGRAGFSVSVAPRRRPGAHLEWAAGGQAWLEVGERRRILARNPRDAFAAATARNLEQAIAAAASGDAPPCSARDARGVLAVVEAAYLSARTGRPVSPSELATAPEPS